MNNKEEARYWITYLEERKKFWQKEIDIADRKMFLLSQELNCKEDCVYRDPKAKEAPYCRYGDMKVILEHNLCKRYINETNLIVAFLKQRIQRQKNWLTKMSQRNPKKKRFLFREKNKAFQKGMKWTLNTLDEIIQEEIIEN